MTSLYSSYKIKNPLYFSLSNERHEKQEAQKGKCLKNHMIYIINKFNLKRRAHFIFLFALIFKFNNS